MSETIPSADPIPTVEGADPGRSALPRRRRTLATGRWLVPFGIAVTLATAGAIASACGSTSASATPVPTCSPNTAKLTVQGTGVATGTPDTLTVEIAISTTATTAQASLTENNAKAAAVLAAFTAGGVARQDMQTTGLSVQPDYTFTHGTEVLTGYGVNNTVTAKVSDLASAGSVIDAVSTAAGDAGQINSVSFSIKDARHLEDEARTDAVHQAVSHAQAMAQSAGERLGQVCSLNDTTPTSQPSAGFNDAAGPLQAPAVPLEVGSQQANAQVTIVYSLKG